MKAHIIDIYQHLKEKRREIIDKLYKMFIFLFVFYNNYVKIFWKKQKNTRLKVRDSRVSVT